jgi:hypothetical protein
MGRVLSRISSMLAEGLAGLERLSEVLAAEKGLAAAERSGEGWAVPELTRIKGECLLWLASQRGLAVAEASFVQALPIARRQDAQFWELRAATALAAEARRIG